MTREEKLQKAHQMFDNRNLLTELKWQREYFKRGYVSNQEELFNLWIFDECIKALEPTTKNDLGVDCISRQSVLDKIQRLINAEQNNIDENGDYMNYARERVNAYEAIQFFVENDCLCPSVTPQEPKTGHWKAFIHNAYHGTDEDGEPIWREVTVYHCSQCNRRTVIKEKYCPNCGAKMVEEQGEAE